MSALNMRADFAAIANWIAPNSQVLDLGCGDGSFLEFLQKQKPVHVYGVEIDDVRVLACVQKSLNVIQQDLEGEKNGRKLDFLVQELLREANTVGSKASEMATTRAVLEVKTEIERIREQVQNLE